MRLAAIFAGMALVLGTAQFALAWGPEAGVKYGNIEGCQYAKTGNAETDGFFVLDAQGLETYGSACVFALVSPETQYGHAIVAICDNEGETEHTINHFRIQKNSELEDTYDVFDDAGLTRTTAGRC